jgi:hypothetical protein
MDDAAGMDRISTTILSTYTHAVVAIIEGGSLPAMLQSSENGPEGRPSGTAVQLAGGDEEDETVSPPILSGWHCEYALL